MNLVFVYGPPAAGKLTVAKELSKITGYKVFNNHLLVGCVSDIFSYDDPKWKETRNRLARKYRLELYAEAAKAGIDLVTTYGGSSKNAFDFFADVVKEVEKNNGNVYFAQLMPTKEALMERVTAPSRVGVKIDSKEFLEQKLTKDSIYYSKFPGKEHPTIDNTDLSPQEVAKQILDYYKLK
jgi:hypothetical protein